MRDCGGAKRSLPVPADALYAPMGAAGLHPPPPQATHHEETGEGNSKVPPNIYINLYIFKSIYV